MAHRSHSAGKWQWIVCVCGSDRVIPAFMWLWLLRHEESAALGVIRPEDGNYNMMERTRAGGA